MSGRPTLHEIAAMPFPQSQDAMRMHYNPDWGKPYADREIDPETGEPLCQKPFIVTIEYTVIRQEEDRVTINATSAEEAERIAREEFRDAHTDDDEIDHVSVRERDA